MELFRKRSMAALAAFFVITSVLLNCVSAEYKIASAIFSAIVLICVAVFYALAKNRRSEDFKKKMTFLILILFTVVFASLYLYIQTDGKISRLTELCGEEAEFRVKVTEKVYENSYSGAYTVKAEKVNGEKVNFKFKLETDFAAEVSVGDILNVRATLSPLENSASFDEKAYYRPKGIYFSGSASDIEVVGKSRGIFTVISLLRETFSSMLGIAMEESGGDFGIASALLLGNRSELDDSVNRDFVYTGASHLLAVSGAHFTILLGGIEAVLRKFSLHKTPKTVIMMLLVISYMALTGFSGSVMRAGFMMLIYYASHFSRREADGVTSLFVSVAIIILISPSSSGDVGLLLSFAAMLALIVVAEMKIPEIKIKVKRFDGEHGVSKNADAKNTAANFASKIFGSFYVSALTSILVIVFTLPVMWMAFGKISLLSPISTFVLNIPVTIVLYLSPITLLTFNIPWLCRVFSYPCAFFCRLTVDLVKFLAQTRFAQLVLPTSKVFMTVGCMIIVICIIVAIAGKRKSAIAASAVLFVSIAVLFSGVAVYRATYDDNEITYICSGKNEGFAVTDGMDALVCDISTGGWEITSATVKEVEERGAVRVKAYLLTHLHTRHEKTVAKLLSRKYVDEIWLPSALTEKDVEIISAIETIAKENGCSVRIYERGTEIVFGDIKIDTAGAMTERSTHPVTALSFESENERITYIGSSVHESEIFAHAADMCRNSDTVIFGIHGPIMKSGASYGIRSDAEVVFSTEEAEKWLSEENPTSDRKVYDPTF